MSTITDKNNQQQTGYKAHCISRGETFSVSHDRLALKDSFNERRIFNGIEDLANRIQHNGFRKTNPITVEWNRDKKMFEVIHGERRFRAVKLLVSRGIDPGPIWCMSESKDTTPLQQLFDQILTNTGEQFTPLEKGRLYLRIQAEAPGTTGVQIADKVGETKQAVSNALRLAKHGSNALHTAIESQRISSTTADSILKEAGEDHAAQDALLATTLATAKESGKSHATPKHVPPSSNKSPNSHSSHSSESPSNVIIPDPNEEDESSSDSQLSTLNSQPNSDAPADPGAMERLKNAPSSNRDGSSGPGSGKYESPDKRLKSIETILDSMDKSGKGHEQRITTTEIVLRYLNNEATAKELKDHLLGK